MEDQHAEQQARGGRGIVELDQAARLLCAQPSRERVFRASDRLVIKRLRDFGKFAALGEDHALERDDFAIQDKLGECDQRVRQGRLDVPSFAGA